MIYLYAFLFCGSICLIGQIILDNTKLTPGHITSILVVVGALLSFFDIYPYFIEKAGMGASLPITSFGNGLFQGAYTGFREKGIIGIFSNMLVLSSSGICGSIIFSFILTMFFEPND